LQAKKSILPLADRGPAAQKPLQAKPSRQGPGARFWPGTTCLGRVTRHQLPTLLTSC